MSVEDNPYGGPYGGSGSSYATDVRFGAAAAQGSGAEAAAAPPASAGELIKETTTAAFAADVIRESRSQPVLVDFWAPWCGPCKQLTPLLERAVREARGRVKLVKMNIDEHPAIAGQLGIQSIPAVIAFRDGQPVDGFMGAVPERQIKDFIARVAQGGGNPMEEALAAAAEAKAAGDTAATEEIYQAVLAEAPDELGAVVGLAELRFEAGQADEATALLARVPADKAEQPQVAALRARIALQQQVSSLGDAEELRRRLAADPKDHQARFDLAMIENAEGRRTEAADNLLAVMRADRSWKEDGARQQLLRFFEAWGLDDPATLAARRKLSSLLFS